MKETAWMDTELRQLRCLSIRQPWAHMILHCGKDVENRRWMTRFRGEFLIHAAKGMTAEEWVEAVRFMKGIGAKSNADAVTHKTILRGGIVGVERLVDCVEKSDSPWFMGNFGFVLADVRPLEFFPCKGSLGFFPLPDRKGGC